MRHLTSADYRRMPWANGRGTTVELWREDTGGGLSFRLSMATVAEGGPFSAFPGIDRVLTVISGPGFRLCGPGHDLRADPLRPVAFPGDVPIAAQGVSAPSEDFNVMVARGRPVRVEVGRPGQGMVAERLFCFALAPATLRLGGRDIALNAQDLLAAEGAVHVVAGGPVLLTGLG